MIINYRCFLFLFLLWYWDETLPGKGPKEEGGGSLKGLLVGISGRCTTVCYELTMNDAHGRVCSCFCHLLVRSIRSHSVIEDIERGEGVGE